MLVPAMVPQIGAALESKLELNLVIQVRKIKIKQYQLAVFVCFVLLNTSTDTALLFCLLSCKLLHITPHEIAI